MALVYALPTSLDLPAIEISYLVSPSNLNPLGACAKPRFVPPSFGSF